MQLEPTIEQRSFGRDMVVLGETFSPDSRPVLGNLGLGSSGEGGNHGEGVSGAQIFGVPVVGKRLAFIVDRSSSMRGRKLDAACSELIGAVSRLQPEQSFFIAFFDIGMFHMVDEEGNAMLRATPKNFERLNRWLKTVRTGRGTEPYKAVRRAIELEPDTMFLLSDGRFGSRTPDYLSSLPLATQLNLTLNTVGFHDRDGGTLERLANEFNGKYRVVTSGIKK